MAVRVAVDAMGGDHAPRAIVRGAVEALHAERDIEIVLVGDELRVHAELEETSVNGVGDRLRVVHASQVVAMDEAPVEALKTKKDSSILRLAELAAAGEVDAVISAGNTGACAAACNLRLRFRAAWDPSDSPSSGTWITGNPR